MPALKKPAKTEMTPEAIRLVAQRFKALSEPARLHILNQLMKGQLSVQQIVERTGLTQANVSRHLAQLADLGFVDRRKEGLFVYYSIADDSIYTLCDLMCSSIARKLGKDLEGFKP